jgi:hypothetical protein
MRVSFDERVADSPDRADESRVGRMRLNLLAELADVHIDYALHDLVAGRIQVAQKLVAGKNSARPRDKGDQEVVL